MLPINVTPNVECKLAKKATSIRVQLGDDAVPTYTKDGNKGLILVWPSSPNERSTSQQPSNPTSPTHRSPGMITNGNGNMNQNNSNISNNLIFEQKRQNNNMGGGMKMNAPPPPIPQRIQSVNGNGNNGYRY